MVIAQWTHKLTNKLYDLHAKHVKADNFMIDIGINYIRANTGIKLNACIELIFVLNIL